MERAFQLKYTARADELTIVSFLATPGGAVLEYFPAPTIFSIQNVQHCLVHGSVPWC